MTTELLYMKNMGQTQCLSKVISSAKNGDRDVLILDQTVFYPQGGGQPYDAGIIKSLDGQFIFEVQEVRFIEEMVHHIGKIKSGGFSFGMAVDCLVHTDRRKLNSRLHSAGHVIDMALKEMDINWIPGKGYHFPQGAYVEYVGKVDGLNLENLKLQIEQKCKEIISRNIYTKLAFDAGKFQNGKPMRTVFYGDFGIPCGGTHVANLNEIVSVIIRKMKQEKDNIRISYSV